MGKTTDSRTTPPAIRLVPRTGPRPLPLHLTTAVNSWLSSRAALPLLRSGSLPWKPALVAPAAALRQAVAAAPSETAGATDAFDQAVDREIRRRLDGLLRGITTYQDHRYKRDLTDPPALWADGTTRLLDYAPPGRGRTRQRSRPVLLVPSLVNRAYILDLSRRRSLARWLATRGLRPLLVDWAAPGPAERGFTLTDYVAGRLDAALTVAVAAAGAPVPVVGYCMGGLLALALALRRPHDVASLALLATPWDFHADSETAANGAQLAALAPLLTATSELPVDLVQSLFYALDPFLVLRKFLAFSALDPASSKAADFVALEDWLNDGVPLAAPVARECLADWYGANTPGRDEWRIAGQVMAARAVAVPTLVVVPQRDSIVPPATARVLGATIPGATTFAPPLGHIGMVVGGRAPTTVWEPLADWLTRP